MNFDLPNGIQFDVEFNATERAVEFITAVGGQQLTARVYGGSTLRLMAKELTRLAKVLDKQETT